MCSATSISDRPTESLQWRHNGHDSVSNHQPHDCLLKRLFRRRSKETSRLRVTGLCAGNSPGTGEFPAQMASNAENVSIWWRHHDTWYFLKESLNCFDNAHIHILSYFFNWINTISISFDYESTVLGYQQSFPVEEKLQCGSLPPLHRWWHLHLGPI